MSVKMRYSLLLLVLLIPAVDGAIFDDWAVDSEVYEADGAELYVVPQTEDNYRVTIVFGEHMLSIDNATCEPHEEIYTICYEGARLHGYDQEKDEEIYEFKIEITDNLADLKITKEIDRTLYPNDIGRMTIRFENTGELTAEDISYSESFSGFILGNPSGCSLNGNTIRASYNSLVPSREKLCSFNIMSKTNRTYKGSGTAKFWNGKEKTEKDSSSFTLEVLEPELIADISYEGNISVDDIQTITFNLSNNGENDIDLHDLYLEHDDVQVMQREGWEDTASGYSIDSILAPDTTISKNLTLKFLKKGNLNLTYSGEFEVLDVRREFSRTLEFDVHLPSPKVFIRDSNLSSGEELILTFSNPTQYIFNDIRITTTDGNRTLTDNIDTIGKKNYKEIDIPVQSEYVEFDIIYHTAYGQELYFSHNKTLDIEGIEHAEEEQGTQKETHAAGEIPEQEEKSSMLKWALIAALLLVIGILIYIVVED